MSNYDAHQRAAILLTCVVCRSSYLCTQGETRDQPFVCVWCRGLKK